MFKMLKLFTLFFLLTTSLYSIYGQQTKVAILSGKIENTAETSIKLSHIELSFEQKINIDSEGNFRDTIKFLENASYYFSLGRTTTQVLIKDGDNLTISGLRIQPKTGHLRKGIVFTTQKFLKKKRLAVSAE